MENVRRNEKSLVGQQRADCSGWNKKGVELESGPVNEIECKIMVTDAPAASETQLNSFGKEGWQLDTIVLFGGKWYYYFPRITEPN